MGIHTVLEITPPLDRVQVDVQFSEMLTIEQLVLEISQSFEPNVIIWYIGCYGLRENGVCFYKDHLISPILKSNVDAAFWLVDLTAWSAFKNPRGSIYGKSSCCEVIEKFSSGRVQFIHSANIFKKMRAVSSTEVVSYFKSALQRTFIHKASDGYRVLGIPARDIIGGNCEIASDWLNCDVSQAYSVFQYLEGCFLIEEVLSRIIEKGTSSNFELIFALPNDELKYYQDEHSSFQKDVKFWLQNQLRKLDFRNIHVTIKFLPFKYGTELHHRPYNAAGKVMKKRNFSYENVVGNDVINRSKYWKS